MPSKKELEIAGEKLKELRNKRNESVHSVGKAIDISGNYLSEIERGIKTPSDEVLEKVADYYEANDLEKDKLFSLYNRIAPKERLALLNIPMFRKKITTMTLDNRLTQDEKDDLFMQFSEIYEKLLNSKK